MPTFNKNYIPLLTFVSVILLSLWNPHWLTLAGVQPYWPIFWLLPWSLANGSLEGSLKALFLGLILDSLLNDIYTQIPGLVLCGFWFGKIGYSKKSLISYQYGLLASIGAFVCGFVYYFQILFSKLFDGSDFLYISYGLKNIVTQIFLTGFLAPIICSWLFKLFHQNSK